MNNRNVIWLPTAKEKLIQYRRERFSAEETLDFISQIILETEDLLRNPVIGRSYTEEFGKYIGISRIVIRRFRIYYQLINKDIVILAILFPGEK